jgi:hypothetical protein
MIRFVKAGEVIFDGRCTTCDARFTYEREDIQKGPFSEWVSCPRCHLPHKHSALTLSFSSNAGASGVITMPMPSRRKAGAR